MKRLISLLAAMVVANLLAGTSVRAADADLTRLVQEATVRLSVQHEGGTHPGYALIIGKRGNTVHAITARHVFCPKRNEIPCSFGELAFGAKAVLFGSQEREFEAVRIYNNDELERTSRTLDLLHLTIDLPPNYPDVDFAFGGPDSRVMDRGDDAWIVGIDRTWDKSSRPFAIDYGADTDRSSGRHRIQFSGGTNPVIGGQSGAPLVGEDGVVGIVVEGNDRRNRGWALPLESIRAARGLAGVPWDVSRWERKDSVATVEPHEPENGEITTERDGGWIVKTGLAVLALVAVGAYVLDAQDDGASSGTAGEPPSPRPTILTIPTL